MIKPSQGMMIAVMIPINLLLSVCYAQQWNHVRSINSVKKPPSHAAHQQRPLNSHIGSRARVHQNPPHLSSSFNHYATPPVQPMRHRLPPPPPSSGLSIQYHDPHLSVQYHVPAQQQSYYQQQTVIYGSAGYIQQSQHSVISDWHRRGLPAPPAGSYWGFEQGRYILVPLR